MTLEATRERLEYLGMLHGKIGIEGEGGNAEIVVRMQMCDSAAEHVYDHLLNIGTHLEADT